MSKKVTFSKNQVALLRQVFETANKAYSKNQAVKPHLYDEHGRYSYIYGYIDFFINALSEDGYWYLDEV